MAKGQLLSVPSWTLKKIKETEEIVVSQKETLEKTTINGKPLNESINLTAEDVNAEAKGTVTTHNVTTDAHNDIRLLITELTNRLNALADSDDDTLDQLSEIVAYIKANKALIESVTITKVNVSDIIDNLTTNVSDRPLSAAQGVVLVGLINTLQSIVDTKADKDHVHTKLEVIDIEPSTDLNSLQTPGLYRCKFDDVAKSLGNCPTPYSFFMIVGKHNGVYQEIIEYCKNPKRFMRNYRNAEWVGWYRIYSTANPPTLEEMNVKIGGTNLLAMSDVEKYFSTYKSYNNGIIELDTENTYRNKPTLKIRPYVDENDVCRSDSGCVRWFHAPLEPGERYIYSFMIYSSIEFETTSMCIGHFQANNESAAHNEYIHTQGDIVPANTWTKVSITFETRAISKFISYFIYFINRDHVINICDVKLEKGTVATDWSPSPEDKADALGSVGSATKPVYFADGKPVECTMNQCVGFGVIDGSKTQIYMDIEMTHGIWNCNLFSITMMFGSYFKTSQQISLTPPSSSSIWFDAANWSFKSISMLCEGGPYCYISAINKVSKISETSYGTKTVRFTFTLSSSVANDLTSCFVLVEPSDTSHTHNYAGSSSAGGAATSAVKLTTSAGSEIKPVYFKDGKPVAVNKNLCTSCVFSDNKTVTMTIKRTTNYHKSDILRGSICFNNTNGNGGNPIVDFRISADNNDALLYKDGQWYVGFVFSINSITYNEGSLVYDPDTITIVFNTDISPTCTIQSYEVVSAFL